MNPRAALVTGASTGIGRATVQILHNAGWTVYAGIRKQADAESILDEFPERVTPLTLDVTNPEHIAETRQAILEGSLPLSGLVNNAGICVSAPVELLEPHDLRRQLEINTIAAHAVTHAMLPMLIESRGVIVNVSSISGRVAFPMVGAYAASKHALEAITDSMRVELRKAGVRVTLVEPGPVRTPIWRKTEDDAERMLESRTTDRYDDAIELMQRVVEAGERDGIPPQSVARVILRSLEAKRPKARVLVGRGLRLQIMLLGVLPTRIRDALIARRMKL